MARLDDVEPAEKGNPGTPLREWLAADVQPRDEVLRIFAQVARALARAHARGIIHGDFKPESVLVTNKDTREGKDSSASAPNSEANVIDFGLGTAIGTPAYMAPEQHDGREADACADQFSFFVTLYEALAKKKPFEGTSSKEIRLAIRLGGSTGRGALNDALPIGLPSRLRSLIMRGLDEKPTRRHASMDVVAAALDEISTPQRRPLAAAMAALVAVLVFAGVLLLYRRDDAALRAAAAKTTSPECRALTANLLPGVTKEEQAAVREAFDRTKLPHAADARERFLGIIHDKMVAIAAMQMETCRGGGPGPESSSAGEIECLQMLLDDTHAILHYAPSVQDRAGLDGAIVAAHAIEPPAICRGALPDPKDPKDPKDRRVVKEHEHDNAIERLLFELPLEVAPMITTSPTVPSTKTATQSLVRVLRVRVREPGAFPSEADLSGITDALSGLPGDATAAAHPPDTAAAMPVPQKKDKKAIAALQRALVATETLHLDALRADVLLLRSEYEGDEPSAELKALVARAGLPGLTATLDLVLSRRESAEGRVRRVPSIEQVLALDLAGRTVIADALLARNELARNQTRSEIDATLTTADATWGPWHARTAIAHVQAAEWFEARGLKALAEERALAAKAILREAIESPSRKNGAQSMYLARALSVLAATTTVRETRLALLDEADSLAKGPLAKAISARPLVVRARDALERGDARTAARHAALAEAAAGNDFFVTRAEASAVLAEATWAAGDRDGAAPLFAKALVSASLLSPRDRVRVRLEAARRLAASPTTQADTDGARALAEQASAEASDPTAAQTLLRSLDAKP